MKKQKRAQKSQFTWKGYLLFFLLVVGVGTVSILASTVIHEKSGEDKLITALSTFAVLIGLTFVCTVIDAGVRKVRLERPVNEIVKATEKITSGDFSVKLAPLHSYGKYDELDIIKLNINRMAQELSQNQLLKSDFVANISHEIKTPLAIINNYTGAIKDDGLTKDQQREYCLAVLNASNRLSELVVNILKLSKLENQEITAKNTMVDLSENLRQSILVFEDKIEQKELTLVCDIDEISIVTDDGLLEIVWNNLLSNAIKFSDIGGEVSVSLHAKDNMAIATVSDKGCGISEQVGLRMFDKFYQGDTSRATQGNGLGLALVKKVVDILGGEIEVDSQQGVGSSFSIKLRLENGQN